MLSRRLLLKDSALALVGMTAAPGWLCRAVMAKDASPRRRKVLIVIFQRGAVDGLNVVVPHGEPAYYALRPSIAIPRPGGEGGAIDLDGRFGLHPALHALKPLWDRKQLAIVEAVGSPAPTRSHFEAQDYMESGTPGVAVTRDGWLNRALAPNAEASPLRAVSMTPDLPLTLRGNNAAIALNNLQAFHLRNGNISSAFEQMYNSSKDQLLNGTARQTFEAIRIVDTVNKTPYAPPVSATYPKNRLGRNLQQVARLIKADVGLQAAFLDVGGWDTHVNEVAAQPHNGTLANLLRDLGDALAAFSADMDDRMEDITLVTMSEFGRTAAENGDRGTDHGHANMMFVLGGIVKGGKIYGDWPGLEKEQLYQARDLEVTTDFRAVLSELVSRQLGNTHMQTVFPNYNAASSCEILAV